MHERFKFRLWDVQNQKYLYFDLFDSESLGDFAFFASEEAPDYNEQIKCPDTNCWALKLEQCTGLKDKNGKLIYENDLIRCPSGIYRIAVDDFCLWTAIYNNNPFEGVGELSDMVKEYVFNQDDVRIEVLGNINENADLLGE